MFESEKIITVQNIEFIGEYLYQRGISEEILENPRYQAILWKLSNILRKSDIKSFSPESKKILDSMVRVDEDGSIYFIEGVLQNRSIVTCKYYFDETDNKLKRIRVQKCPDENYIMGNVFNSDKYDDYTSVSTYNEDGIEESLAIEQNTLDGKYFSKSIRVPNRIDMIKIERLRQQKDDLKRLEDIYQIRSMQAALEDISPDAEDIDPFNIMHFDILGLPDTYRDLNFEEQVLIANTNGKILPLPETERKKKLQRYKELNVKYGRIKAFEKGIAKAFLVKNQDMNR